MDRIIQVVKGCKEKLSGVLILFTSRNFSSTDQIYANVGSQEDSVLFYTEICIDSTCERLK